MNLFFLKYLFVSLQTTTTTKKMQSLVLALVSIRWSKKRRVKKNWCCKHHEEEEGWSNSGVETHTHTLKSQREMRMLLLLFSSTAPPKQASPLTSPAEQSAFMFFSKSQVVLPRATLAEPGAKAACSSVAVQTTATHAHPYSGINVPSCYTHPRTAFTHTHTLWLSERRGCH